jgi:SAM-dependent methyltransferase
MAGGQLTASADWDEEWESKRLPAAVERATAGLYVQAILDVIDAYLPEDPQLSILEIGGAPGQYLAYMHRYFGYAVHCLDYSAVGCQKAEENLRLLGIPAQVYNRDLFAPDVDLPPFDIVYSLGVIEHFADLPAVVERHLRLLKPGGTLLLGVPNFGGIYHGFLRRLAPHLLSQHNLAAMDLRNWEPLEHQFGLRPLFKGYVGGFEASILHRCEKKTPLNRLLFWTAKGLKSVLHRRLRFLRRVNGRFISGYMMGVYEKPANRR